MMKLVADSGSTKTTWMVLKERSVISRFSTIGLNPWYVSAEIIYNELASVRNWNEEPVKEIYFYGAGCATESKKEIVHSGLSKMFPLALIQVETDMLGAARAESNQKKSFVAILGTGSNCCLFDGSDIIYGFPSTGFILGDEGSGADIGKKLLKAFLENGMPDNIRLLFEKEFHITGKEILDHIYRQPFPNRFAASFCPFVAQNITSDFLHDLVKTSFTDFFEKTLCKHSEHKLLPLQVIGSVGFYFEDLLREVSEEKNIIIENIKANPSEGLAQYHSV